MRVASLATKKVPGATAAAAAAEDDGKDELIRELREVRLRAEVAEKALAGPD